MRNEWKVKYRIFVVTDTIVVFNFRNGKSIKAVTSNTFKCQYGKVFLAWFHCKNKQVFIIMHYSIRSRDPLYNFISDGLWTCKWEQFILQSFLSSRCLSMSFSSHITLCFTSISSLPSSHLFSGSPLGIPPPGSHHQYLCVVLCSFLRV